MNIFKLFLLTLALGLQIPLHAANKSTPQQRAAVIMQHLNPGTRVNLDKKDLLTPQAQQQRAKRMLEAMLPEESSWTCTNLTMEPCNAQTPQGPSATEAFINSFTLQELDALCTKIGGKTVSKNKPFINQLIAQEKRYGNTHYAFYHGMNKDVMLALLLNTELARAFEGVESPTWFKLRATPDFYNKKESLENFLSKHKNIVDMEPPYQQWLLSTNLSFPGFLQHEGSSTFRYFYENHSASSKNLLENLFAHFISCYAPEYKKHNAIHKIIINYAQEFSNIAKKHSSTGALLQIFIKKDATADCVYLAQALGHPHNKKFTNNHNHNLWLADQNRYKANAHFLELYQKNCASFTMEERINLQARLLLTKDLFAQPHDAISMHLWHEIPQQEFTQLQKEIRFLVNDFIHNFFESVAKFKHNNSVETLTALENKAHAIHDKTLYSQLMHIYLQNISTFTPETVNTLTCIRPNISQMIQLPHTFLQLNHYLASCLTYSSCGSYILTGSWDHKAHLWDAKTGEKLHTFNHVSAVSSVAFSPCGAYILIGSLYGTAYLWDIKTGKTVRMLNHIKNIASVAFSPCGAYILTGSWDSTACLWDTKTGKKLHTFNHDGEVTSVAFSPCSKYILTGSWDSTACLWDAKTKHKLNTFKHTNWITSVAFSPCGTYILTGSWDTTACLWNVKTGKKLHTFKQTSLIASIAFSPCGTYILTGSSSNHKACFWNVKTGVKLHTFDHDSNVTSLAFSPCGTYITIATEKTVYMYYKKPSYNTAQSFAWLLKKIHRHHNLPYLAEATLNQEQLQKIGTIYQRPDATYRQKHDAHYNPHAHDFILSML